VLKNLLLTRHRIVSMPKVKIFLDSIGRNSERSKSGYHLGLSCFQDFLDRNYAVNSFTLETIIQPLIENQIAY
jgi:hypothetical protein